MLVHLIPHLRDAYSSSTCWDCWLLLSHCPGIENCPPLKWAILPRSYSVPKGSLHPMTNQGRVTMALFSHVGQLWQALPASELLMGSSEICVATLMPYSFPSAPSCFPTINRYSWDNSEDFSSPNSSSILDHLYCLPPVYMIWYSWRNVHHP